MRRRITDRLLIILLMVHLNKVHKFFIVLIQLHSNLDSAMGSIMYCEHNFILQKFYCLTSTPMLVEFCLSEGCWLFLNAA